MPVGFLSNGLDIESQYIRKSYFFEGQVWTWGRNYNRGSIGASGTTAYSSPVNLIGGAIWSNMPYTLSCGDSSTAMIKTDGTLWTWGYNNNGQLGTNDTTNYSSPVQTVATGTWKRVSAGRFFYHAIKSDGTLWGWGQNNYGQLGHGSFANKSSPVQILASSSVPWLQTSGGYLIAGGIKTDGTLWTWGHNSYGQLGQNNRTLLSTPVQVGTDTTWKQLKCGTTSMSAIKSDGTLWVWGYNVFGNLGTNNTTNYSSPVQTVAGGTNWKSLDSAGSAIGYTVSAIKTDGTLWSWGLGSTGQLGDGTNTSKSSAVQTVAGGTNWKMVTSNGNQSFAIKTDGTLWAWGYNYGGVLGDGTTTNRNSPVQIGAKTWWINVGCGYGIQGVGIINSSI